MVEKKKATVKKTEKSASTKCECCNNTEILNRIFYCLIAIIAILAFILVAIVVKTNSTSTTDATTTETEEETGEYDVSMFETLTTSEALEKISDGGKYLVYVGRSTCGYCVKFLPNLQQAQEEYGYTTIYINLEEMTSDDQENILSVDKDDYIKENLGYTPMVLVFENGKLSNGTVGYTEYDEFASFLEENGYTK